MKQLRQLSVAAIFSALFALATADWQYRSRSDLATPRLNITIPATDDVEPGYLFIAPFAGIPDTPSEQHGPRQAGPYIFKDNGDLVWSGYGIYSIWSTNFQAGRWKGKNVLFSFEGDHNAGYGHGHGHITFLDQHYETIRELRAGNHKLVDKHEFEIVDEETGPAVAAGKEPRRMRFKRIKRASKTSSGDKSSVPPTPSAGSDGGGPAVQRVINVKNCPLCHRLRLNAKVVIDIITHLAICASNDWNQVDRIVVGNFVTASQAQRKWYSKIIGKVST